MSRVDDMAARRRYGSAEPLQVPRGCGCVDEQYVCAKHRATPPEPADTEAAAVWVDRDGRTVCIGDEVVRASDKRDKHVGDVVARKPRGRVLVRWAGDHRDRVVRCDYLAAAYGRRVAEHGRKST